MQSESVIDTSLEADGTAELAHGSFNRSESPSRAPAARRLATASPSASGVTKRLLDVVGALVLGVVFSPLIVVIVFLMRRRGGGSVIYKHRRVGRGGQMFACLKFRTMVPDADQVLRELLENDPELHAEWVRDHKLRHDPRVTRLGRFLRRTSLDELPQLVNVLRGEMSLVGPRPHPVDDYERYNIEHLRRLDVKPGLTGLWQVTARRDPSFDTNMALDLEYIENWSLWLDLKIALRTLPAVLRAEGN